MGYSDTKEAIKDNIDKEDIKTWEELRGDQSTPFENMHPQTKFTNESGLYALIFNSKLKKAKEFKHWVTSEVLPSLRKTGKYEIPKEDKKVKLEMCKLLLEVSPTDRDRLLIADCIRNELTLKQITNGEPNKEEEWSCSRRLQEHFKITNRKQHNQLTQFGKVMKQKYTEKYNKKPPTRTEYVAGQVRTVNHYVLSDWEAFGDKAMKNFFNL